jgi:hypothetical protein
MNYRHCEPIGVDALVAEMLDSSTSNFDPIEELFEAMKRGQDASLTTTIAPKTCTCGGRCDHDRHTVNLVIDHFDEIFEEMATKIIEKAVDDRIGDTAFGIRTILANHKKNAFTVVWEDGESTVIHLQEGDEWDDEKALAMCFVKKLFGNKGSFNYIFTETLPSKLKVIPKEEKKTSTISVDTSNGTIFGTIGCGVSTVTNRIDEVEKKIDNVEKTVDDLKVDIKKVGVTAEAASDNFSKLVGVLAGTPTPIPNPVEEVRKYEVYLYNLYSTDKFLLGEDKTLNELPKFISEAQKKRITYPGYTRFWSDKTGLYIDYGSHSYYFYIPGLTTEEYNKALNKSN